MFDFASASRNEGNLPGLNDKGLVTYDRKIKKDAFYFYKSAWAKSPVLHITSRRRCGKKRFGYRCKGIFQLRNIRLKVNGQECGNPIKRQNIYIWQGVGLRKGENQIEVCGDRDRHVLSEKCNWILL